MSEIIRNLKNPMFTYKLYYVILLPLMLLDLNSKYKIKQFASKHWDKNPKFMHRLYWICN